MDRSTENAGAIPDTQSILDRDTLHMQSLGHIFSLSSA